VRGGARRHDHVDLEPDELGRERRQPLVLPVRAPGLEDHGPALDIPELAHPLTERFPQGSPGREGPVVQEPDPGDGSLRLGGERRGEESEDDREDGSEAIHVHLRLRSSGHSIARDVTVPKDAIWEHVRFDWGACPTMGKVGPLPDRSGTLPSFRAPTAGLMAWDGPD
jgi:hypothetical protein